MTTASSTAWPAFPSPSIGIPSRIFLQIAHAGRQTKERLCGCVPVSPSAVYDPVSKVMPRELTGEEIRALIADFVAAAGRAKRAGFDGVQLHAAHGYLISSFLSPHTNRRTDEWGGPVENRARVLLEVLRGVKAVVRPRLPGHRQAQFDGLPGRRPDRRRRGPHRPHARGRRHRRRSR